MPSGVLQTMSTLNERFFDDSGWLVCVEAFTVERQQDRTDCVLNGDAGRPAANTHVCRTAQICTSSICVGGVLSVGLATLS